MQQKSLAHSKISDEISYCDTHKNILKGIRDIFLSSL